MICVCCSGVTISKSSASISAASIGCLAQRRRARRARGPAAGSRRRGADRCPCCASSSSNSASMLGHVSATLLAEERARLASRPAASLASPAASRRRSAGGASARAPAPRARRAPRRAARASRASILPARTSSASESSRRMMPSALPRCCRLGIWKVLLSRMRFQSAIDAGQQLGRGDARSVPSALRHQPLADDEAQAAGERHAHLRLIAGREEIDQPVDGLGRARRVHRADAPGGPVSLAASAMRTVSVSRSSPTTMTSGILAQRALERRRERARVRAHLALADHAPSCAGARTRSGSSTVMMWCVVSRLRMSTMRRQRASSCRGRWAR